MTYGKRQYESVDSIMRETILTLYTTTQELLPAIDADSEAFTSYMVYIIYNSLINDNIL